MKRLCIFIFLSLFVVGMVKITAEGQKDSGLSKPITIKLGHLYAPDHPYTSAIKEFAAEVKDLTNGQLVIKDYPAGQLGNEKDMCDAVSMNTLDMSIIGPGELAKRHDPIFIFDGPYVFRDTNHMLKTAASSVGQEMWDSLVEKSNIRVLNVLYYGKKHITTSRRPVENPMDMRGLKFRVIDSPMNMAIARSLGASPVPMAFTELYLGLQQGVVEGQENPIPTIISQRLYEVQKYLILSGAICQGATIVISDKTYQSLSSENQEILNNALNAMVIEVNDKIVESEFHQIEELKEKGMIVIQPDLEPFREATKVVIKEFESKWGAGLYERIQEVK
ncbi:sialic acid TRAP transporter substrate-binding protein SiaP [Marispirochaeta sp.]|uniref:sialic acid TRAP transporter substrate-binding protein SiaP n=1 Tax=Marispirochaeta sp. TaxID=2038653 RepID=UPI0029C672DA|nr:sialic acid TRAP transporter substrate-binding protein SiaP [Marispirochaeta sp.]